MRRAGEIVSEVERSSSSKKEAKISCSGVNGKLEKRKRAEQTSAVRWNVCDDDYFATVAHNSEAA